MDPFRRHVNAVVNVAALVVPLGVAGILVPFRSSFADTAAALVLVAVIVAIAVFGSRTAGYLAAISATVWFDFFLTQPFQRLQITHRPDIETTVSLFVVGIVVTELAARSRHHHQAAAEQSDYVGLIYDLSELAASGAPASDVIERARTDLVDLLHLRSCRYDGGRPERARLRIEHDGQVVLGGVCGESTSWVSPDRRSNCSSTTEDRRLAVSCLRRLPGSRCRSSAVSSRWLWPIRPGPYSGRGSVRHSRRGSALSSWQLTWGSIPRSAAHSLPTPLVPPTLPQWLPPLSLWLGPKPEVRPCQQGNDALGNGRGLDPGPRIRPQLRPGAATRSGQVIAKARSRSRIGSPSRPSGRGL